MADANKPVPSGWTDADARAFVHELSQTWPELAPPDAEFFAHATERFAHAGSGESRRLAELYLAYACSRGDADAIAVFVHNYGGAIASAVRRARDSAHAPEDLRQIVLDRLLVGERAALRTYTGRGSLAAWVGVVALRAVINATRGTPRPVVPLDESSAIAALLPHQDPELDHLRARYRTDFKSAFEAAVTELAPRERTLLHQHLVERLTVRELARIYGVNSGTVARWVVRARTALAERTTGLLSAQLHVSPVDLESVLRLVRSRVDLSLSRVFVDAAP